MDRIQLQSEAGFLASKLRDDFLILGNPLALYKDPVECVELFKQRSTELKAQLEALIDSTTEQLESELERIKSHTKLIRK
jgi:hypothetical protein